MSHCVRALLFIGLSVAGQITAAEVPDLTQGGKPTTQVNGNLGPTGVRGWVYHQPKRTDTSLSRQILITEVDEGSPADGILAVGDVILGADGTGAAPRPFTSDARRSFAEAIADAEARNPATLQVIRWRGGQTGKVTLTLESLGAYSPTAPYDCPKSRKILLNALAYLDKNQPNPSRFGFNLLALLACNDDGIPGNAERMKRAREWVIQTLPGPKDLALMTDDRIETQSKIAWTRSYTLISLAEYYLATGDNPSNGDVDLLTAIDAHARTITRGQSMFGTMGHHFARTSHGPYAVGYGPVNAVGLASFVGLVMARECKLPNAETRAQIDAGIARAGKFFSAYAWKGSIPYGEHPAWTQSHGGNGKNGLAALALARIDGYQEHAKYFSQITIAAATERVSGHGGAFFNYTWTPLGAHVGGPEAVAAYFREVSWHLDLSRTWEGGFYYNDYANYGFQGPTFSKASLFMSTPAILTYALPLRKLWITGRGIDPAGGLSPDQVKAASFAGAYAPAKRSTSELIADLGSFSVTVAQRAGKELASRDDAAASIGLLHDLVRNPQCRFRERVIEALTQLKHPESAEVLGKLIADDANPDGVRALAAQALTAYPEAIPARLDATLRFTAGLAYTDPPMSYPDPMASALEVMCNALPKMIGKDLKVVDQHSSREQFYAAFRALMSHPGGRIRSHAGGLFDALERHDVFALADTLMGLILVEAPADAMFAENIRSKTVELLQKHGIAEGVPAGMILFNEGGNWTRIVLNRTWAKYGGSVHSIEPDPGLVDFLRNLGGKPDKEVMEALKAIEEDSPSGVTLTPLKEIKSVTATPADLRLPAREARLNVEAINYPGYQSRYTWRKVHGAGQVTFTPNGTQEAKQTRVTFDGKPGQYRFEVRMSDDRGFTEVTETVTVTLQDASGQIPANQPQQQASATEPIRPKPF